MAAEGGRFKGEKRTIVAYCACANEMTAARAAVDLAALGIPGAKALKGGWDEWVAARREDREVTSGRTVTSCSHREGARPSRLAPAACVCVTDEITELSVPAWRSRP